MSYQIFPLTNYTDGKISEEEKIIIVSAPFTALITKIHSRLKEGDCTITLRIGSTIIDSSEMIVIDEKVSLDTSIQVEESEPISMLITDPVDAMKLEVQLTLKRI